MSCAAIHQPSTLLDLVKSKSRVDIFQVYLLPNKLSAVLSFDPELDFVFSLYVLRTDVFCIKLLLLEI